MCALLAALLAATTAAQKTRSWPADPVAERELGRRLFFDPALSASGKLACSTCHDPHHAYAPANDRAVQLGGPNLDRPGTRAVPSLRYTLQRTPRWSAQFQSDPIEQLLDLDATPVGGFDWDGRFDTLHEQAQSPLLAENQMANASRAALVLRISHAPYSQAFAALYGVDIWSDPDRAFALAAQALERFELDDPSFQPFTSRFDEFLDGKARLTAQERRGLAWFDAPDKGNCASCHPSARGADGSHPLFTDFGFQSLGVPRNPRIPANRDPTYFDLGLCGPQRRDLSTHTAYCGMFKTPSLRNVATRRVFFHNGDFHSLREVLRFYVARDRDAQRWYPHRDGRVERYDDLPPDLRGNVDHFNAPFDGGDDRTPALDAAQIEDVLAFLGTLTDRDAAPPHAPAGNQGR
jgi:cytochrome c peroxidase